MINTDKNIVLVLGASTKPHRYSNKAINALNSHGHHTILIGREEGATINDNIVLSSFSEIPKDLKIDTITMYLSEKNQASYEDDILALAPNRVIFNPGAENNGLYIRLKENNIEALNACTLVMLSIGNF